MERTPRVLIVDDDDDARHALGRMIESSGYETEKAHDGLEALAKVVLDIDLVLLDLVMPGMDGFEVARRVRRGHEAADVPIIMVTGTAGRTERLRAVEAGVNDFIAKPVDLTELEVRSASLLKMKAAQDALKRHRAELEATVEKRTEALRRALEKMAAAQRSTYEAQLETIRRLAIAAEYRDEDTADHIRRIGHYCAVLARALGLPPGEAEVVLHASPMHDVGKIGISDTILFKPGELTPEEFSTVKEHTHIGARILSSSTSQLLQAGEVIACSHHEKWDGSGYPKGLAGDEIPLLGRLCAVADVFDALTTKRPYKPAFPNEQAFAILREGTGKHFDPQIVEVFFDHVDDVIQIQKEHAVGGPEASASAGDDASLT